MTVEEPADPFRQPAVLTDCACYNFLYRIKTLDRTKPFEELIGQPIPQNLHPNAMYSPNAIR